MPMASVLLTSLKVPRKNGNHEAELLAGKLNAFDAGVEGLARDGMVAAGMRFAFPV
ncbi:MAG: hypothetical protein IPN07_14905 [Dehalococcoidia bacterium]|nr:hypothetical protein [Dehalococcoidia bacterium]